MYYIHKNYLGSYYCITNQNGNVVENEQGIKQIFSFDPCSVKLGFRELCEPETVVEPIPAALARREGRRHNPTDWTYNNVPQTHLFDRGFTGHEHLDNFDLINMNGRVYDPWLGRFLSPDPFVQAPTYSQNFNRYSYALNNPLKYTDPSGKFLVVDSWIIGFVRGFFSTGKGRWQTGRNKANQMAVNDIKIWGGLFVTDPNKTFSGKVWEVFSRFTWQSPQTAIGWTASQFTNTFFNVNWIEYKYGATVSNINGDFGAFTLGSYINGDETIEANASNELFQHEYGHYIQSQAVGWLYLPKYALPSLRSAKKNSYKEHIAFWVEQDANIRANKYFNKNIKNYKNWKYWSNPIFNSGYNGDFDNNYGYLQTNKGIVNPKWWEYTITLGGAFMPNWLLIFSLNKNKGQ